MDSKWIKIRVLKVNFNANLNINLNSLNEKFKKENLSDNIIDYDEESQVVIISANLDSNGHEFFYGRILRLRKEEMKKINTKTAEEGDIRLDNDEDLYFDSHFILNLNEKLMFIEYNRDAAGEVIDIWQTYFNRLFRSDGASKIEAVIRKDALEKYLNSDRIKTLQIEVAAPKLRLLEGAENMDALETLAEASEMPDKLKIGINIIAGGRSKLKKSFIEKLLKHLIKKKEDIRTLKGAADDSIFQLIAEDLLTYEIEVIANLSYKRYFLSEEDFYPKVESLYKNKIDEINAYLHED